MFHSHDHDVFTPDLFYDEQICEPEAPDLDGVATCSAADDACIRCKDQLGRVDLPFMSRISGLTEWQLIAQLEGSAIFRNPEADPKMPTERPEWLFADQYLSGNVVQKLKQAKETDKKPGLAGKFTSNITALKKLLPDAVPLEDIHIPLGATWIPSGFYKEFITSLLGPYEAPDVYYSKELCRWKVEGPRELRTSVRNNMIYGTAQCSAIKIIQDTMNAQIPKVYKTIPHYDGRDERVVDSIASLAAQEKQHELLNQWDKWVHAEARRRKRLKELYNQPFVCYAHSPYDGAFLTLPDLNPSIQLYPHQRNAVARILLSGSNTLLAHDTGSGKTLELVVSVHELKRTGLSRKNLVVVPNSVLGAVVQTHRDAYPRDRILPVFPHDFTPDKRDAILRRIRDEDQVAVYMSFSSFEMLCMSKAYYERKILDQIRDLRTAAVHTPNKNERKWLESRASQMVKYLQKYRQTGKSTPWLCYDELGITTLMVDEAHHYKNITLDGGNEDLVGYRATGSRRCDEMLEKVHNTPRVVFATATPLTNSLSDVYTMQRYLQPEELEARGLDSFGIWLTTFAERETLVEVDVDGSGIRTKTRFSRFHNLTELMGMFSIISDFFQDGTQSDALPAFGGYQNISVPPNRAQKAYVENLAQRTECIRRREVSQREDNLLKITADGRKAALDIRLVQEDAGLGEEELSKTAVCAQKIAELYHRYPGTSQAVMSDIGTPKEAFNVYDQLRCELVNLGIPWEQIAFIHTATTEKKRNRLLQDVNDGTVRIIIGSTGKLGTGLNIQQHLVALHHLSVPWRPADMVQREGRILRRGNTCPEVFIYRYITEGTFDSYSYQLLESKQRFIASFLAGTGSQRSMEDIADTVLSYAEAKALAIGNPLIKTRVETANELERTRIATRQRQRSMLDLRDVISSIPEKVRQLTTLLDDTLRDDNLYRSRKESIPNSERLSFGEELLWALEDNLNAPEDRLFDTYQGFSVILPAHMTEEQPCICLVGGKGTRHRVDMKACTAYSCSRRLDAALEGLSKRIQQLQEQIDRLHRQREDARQDLEAGNPHEIRMQILSQRLEEIDRQLEEGKRPSNIA